jgi:Methane oxygenase PmoA
MRLELTKHYVDFVSESSLAGRYWYQDSFKPHIHPLNTPDGHTLSLRSPHDHPHHKGLMYSLRAADINFWEEYATTEAEKVGHQRHDTFCELITEGEEVGFTEQLTWLASDGSLETFDEQRSLTCSYVGGASTYFRWKWSTRLVAKRDLTLTLSPWSVTNNRGHRINYHGLGLRLRRDFGCTGGNKLLLDGQPVSFEEALGLAPNEATFIGTLDETSGKAGVTIAPCASHGLFVLQSPFAFISFGPTVLGASVLRTEDTLNDSYSISVFDGKRPRDQPTKPSPALTDQE